jgi:ubiquinol-cytochrome c reductase cytochrome c1 subunit
MPAPKGNVVLYLSVRRGYEVYRQICATCHSMYYQRFWFLINKVYPARRVRDIAAQYEATFTNAEGEQFTRKLTEFDRFPRPYPTHEGDFRIFKNQQAESCFIAVGAAANGGKEPPDLSMGTAQWSNGPEHVFEVLTGYVNLRVF